MTTPAVELRNDRLVYRRGLQAKTELDMADLEEVAVLASNDLCYWHLRTRSRGEALVPVGIPGEAQIRQYLSHWRGFDYDALVRFVSEPPVRGSLRLWPLI